MLYESKFLLALLITVLIEVPILLLFLPLFEKDKLNILRVSFVGALASALTLPYFWFVFPNFFSAESYIFGGEIVITLVEALVFIVVLRVGVLRAVVASVVANAASYFGGIYVIKYLLTIF